MCRSFFGQCGRRRTAAGRRSCERAEHRDHRGHRNRRTVPPMIPMLLGLGRNAGRRRHGHVTLRRTSGQAPQAMPMATVRRREWVASTKAAGCIHEQGAGAAPHARRADAMIPPACVPPQSPQGISGDGGRSGAIMGCNPSESRSAAWPRGANKGHRGQSAAIGCLIEMYYESEGQEFQSLRTRQFLLEMYEIFGWVPGLPHGGVAASPRIPANRFHSPLVTRSGGGSWLTTSTPCST